MPIDQLPELYALPPQCIATDDDKFPVDATLYGVFQLLSLGLAYVGLLSYGSNLISDGSELLLLIPSIEPVVGSLVLPILGAVPDGCIVLFSGLGPRSVAQKQVAVGVGALAGSTVQLLTVPWFLSIWAGRVDMSAAGHAVYRGKKRLSPGNFWHSAVQPSSSVMRAGALALFATTLPYFIIQGSAFTARGDETAEQRIASEGSYALAGSVLCFVLLALYIVHNARGHNESQQTVVRGKQEDARVRAIAAGRMTLEGAFFHALNHRAPALLRQMSARGGGGSSSLRFTAADNDMEDELKQFRCVLWNFVRTYDRDGSHTIDAHELGFLLSDIGFDHSPESVAACLAEMDSDMSGSIDFDEFIVGMARRLERNDADGSVYAAASSSAAASATAAAAAAAAARTTYGSIEQPLRVIMEGRHASQQQEQRQAPSAMQSRRLSNGALRDGDDEEEEDDDDDLPSIPDDLADLTKMSVAEQQRRILWRALGMMALGSIVVILISDPLVDVLNAIGEVVGVSAFYVSFCLAPIASNASEYIATYKYSKKQSAKSISISLSTLVGAGVLNNTFVLGIFLALVKFRELEWTFSAETLAILGVEMCMVVIAMQPVQTMRTGFVVLSLFPLSLVAVAILENVVGWD